MPPLEIQDVIRVGENDHGWQFAVGRLGDRWIGFGMESENIRAARRAFAEHGMPTTPGYMHIFAEICEGYQLGIKNKLRCILLTGAIAENPEAAFGGVDHWFVPAKLRGNPDDFRCHGCGEILCANCGQADWLGEEDIPL